MISQSEFSKALFNAEQDIPGTINHPDRGPAPKRFSVYRNNVAHSLIEALASGFPVLQTLIGKNGFRDLANHYWRVHPPKTPILWRFGHNLAEYLEQHSDLQEYPYLPDIARLEFALRESYHAENAEPIHAELLSEHPPEQLMELSIHFAPSCRLLSSPWPIYSIWKSSYEGLEIKNILGAESIMIARSGFDPKPYLLGEGAYDCALALKEGKSLGEAYETGAAGSSQFDLAALIAQLLEGEAIVGINNRGGT